jgi:hypothetical protein
MKRERRQINVPVEPLSEGRWDRIERRIEEERAMPPVVLRPWPRRLAISTAMVGAALAGMIAVIALRPAAPARPTSLHDLPDPPAATGTPMVITTPTSAGTSLHVGDAEVQVAPDSAIAVRRTDDGTITIELAHGGVDCDVTPRPNRPPFYVIASDVTVTVVGTRFTVERDADVRVAVTRGHVRVRSPRGEQAIAEGQSWAQSTNVVAIVGPTGAPASPTLASLHHDAGPAAITSAADPDLPPLDADAPRPDLASADKLLTTNPRAAAAAYHAIASAGANDADAELALWHFALLEQDAGKVDASIAAVADYEHRFPNGAHLEELLWLRVEASCVNWRQHKAAEAAAAYVRHFPNGPHHTQAARGSDVCGSL